MRQVIGIYRGKGHQVTDVKFTETEERPIHTILADNEFAAIQAEMEEDGINVNITAKEEHVPEVERQNRVIKERARAIIQTMPYAGIPRKIRIALIQYVVYWLNNIPKSGQEHSPRDLISGEKIEAKGDSETGVVERFRLSLLLSGPRTGKLSSLQDLPHHPDDLLLPPAAG